MHAGSARHVGYSSGDILWQSVREVHCATADNLCAGNCKQSEFPVGGAVRALSPPHPQSCTIQPCQGEQRLELKIRTGGGRAFYVCSQGCCGPGRCDRWTDRCSRILLGFPLPLCQLRPLSAGSRTMQMASYHIFTLWPILSVQKTHFYTNYFAFKVL